MRLINIVFICLFIHFWAYHHCYQNLGSAYKDKKQYLILLRPTSNSNHSNPWQVTFTFGLHLCKFKKWDCSFIYHLNDSKWSKKFISTPRLLDFMILNLNLLILISDVRGRGRGPGYYPHESPPSVLSLMKCQNISCACPSIHLQYLLKIFSGTYHLLSIKGTAVNKTGGPCPPCPLRVCSLAKKMSMKV